MKESINHLSSILFNDKQKVVFKSVDKLKELRDVGKIKAYSVTFDFLNSKLPQNLPRLHMKNPGFKGLEGYIAESDGYRNLLEQLNQKYGGKYTLNISVTNTKLTVLVSRA